MPRKSVTRQQDNELDDAIEDLDDEPIPARRDTRIFQRDEDKKKEEKEEDFEEDVFV